MSEGTGRRARRWSIGTAVDQFFFVFAGLAAIWLAYLSFTETFAIGCTFDTSVGLSLCGGDSIRTDGDLPIVDVRQVTA